MANVYDTKVELDESEESYLLDYSVHNKPAIGIFFWTALIILFSLIVYVTAFISFVLLLFFLYHLTDDIVFLHGMVAFMGAVSIGVCLITIPFLCVYSKKKTCLIVLFMFNLLSISLAVYTWHINELNATAVIIPCCILLLSIFRASLKYRPEEFNSMPDFDVGANSSLVLSDVSSGALHASVDSLNSSGQLQPAVIVYDLEGANTALLESISSATGHLNIPLDVNHKKSNIHQK